MLDEKTVHVFQKKSSDGGALYLQAEGEAKAKWYHLTEKTKPFSEKLKEGDKLKKTTRYVDKDKLENKIDRMKARDAYLKSGEDDLDRSGSSVVKRGGTIKKPMKKGGTIKKAMVKKPIVRKAKKK